MQQAAAKKSSSTAAINADQRRDQNSVSRDMIERWASEESTDIQDAAQQMKTVMKSREIWVKTARNQKTETCYDQVTYSSLQDREHSNHSNKNKQNWDCSILESDMNVRYRILCLLMWMSERNHSTCNNILSLLCENKTSDSRSAHESSEYQRSYQQLRENVQTDQMIHLITNFVIV